MTHQFNCPNCGRCGSVSCLTLIQLSGRLTWLPSTSVYPGMTHQFNCPNCGRCGNHYHPTVERRQ